MMRQISIFEIAGLQEPINWQELSAEELANTIAYRFGAIPKLNRFGDYAFMLKPCDVSISIGTYNTYDERNGKKFISVSVDNKKAHCGSGGPCDSIEEALNFIERALKRWENEQEEKP